MNISEQIDELIERQRGLNKLNKLPANVFYYVAGCGLVDGEQLLSCGSYIICDANLVRSLYVNEYMNTARIGLLPNELQPLVFHIAVSDGLREAISFLQKTLNKLLSDEIDNAFEITGRMDFDTIGAAKYALLKYGARYVISFIVNAYIEYCRSLYKDDRITFEKKSFLARRFVH